MGSKATQESPPPPVIGDTTQPGLDEAALTSILQAMAAQSAATAALAAQPPPQPELPAVYTTPEIDWGDKLEQLNAKAAGETAAEIGKKKGVLDTIHTGLLLDDEDPETTKAFILG